MTGTAAGMGALESRELIVLWDAAPLRDGADLAAALQTELLRGERFRARSREGEWVHGAAAADGYEGYVPAGALGGDVPPATHRVAARSTLLYREPDATSETAGIAWLGSRFQVAGGASGGFVETEAGQFLYARHLVPVDHAEDDPAAVAERLCGAPYRYGGRTGAGLDCSALVQLSLQAAGIASPRDAEPCMRQLGDPVPEGAALQRNDLAFWEDHVGILLDGVRLLHANAHHMAVAAEPLAVARARIADKGVAWRGVRRIQRLQPAAERAGVRGN